MLKVLLGKGDVKALPAVDLAQRDLAAPSYELWGRCSFGPGPGSWLVLTTHRQGCFPSGPAQLGIVERLARCFKGARAPHRRAGRPGDNYRSCVSENARRQRTVSISESIANPAGLPPAIETARL